MRARLAALYRATCEHLALARVARVPGPPDERLEALTQRAPPARSTAAATSASPGSAACSCVDFPQAVRAHRLHVLIATLLFAVPLLVRRRRQLCSTPASSCRCTTRRRVEQYDRMYGGGDEPIGRQRDADTDWEMFGFYISNNIGIAFQCFAGGLLLRRRQPVLPRRTTARIGGAVAGYLTCARPWRELLFLRRHARRRSSSPRIVLAGAAGLSLGHALLAPGPALAAAGAASTRRGDAVRHRSTA